MRAPRSAGYSLLEVLLALGVAVTVAAAAGPGILASVEEHRTLAGVRYVSTRLHRTRLEAVTRHASSAMRFIPTDGSYAFGVYADGNGDGVRAVDVAAGIDPNVQAEERLPDHFRGVDFGTLPDLPAVDDVARLAGDDPIRFGPANAVTFTANGTATSGSLYIRGGQQAQYVIRVFGETGKIRILEFNTQTRLWQAP